ncbi:hypothetical protein [Cupriavidus necator]|uniref:hypothetical protein n=1 Tax=Cupriavidus necator TaxID=106590 RepID=UPI00339D504D
MDEDQITTLEQFAEAMAGDAPEGEEPQEVENAQPDEEAQSDDQPEPADGEESNDEPAEDDQPETESPDDAVLEWETASGEKFSAPVSELKAGYMRSQDYTHKTQALAREREGAQQHIEQQFQHVQAYAQDYGALHATSQQLQQLESAIGSINQYEDPVGWNTAVNNLLLLRQERDKVAGRIQQFQQFKAAEAQQATAEAQKKAAETLAAEIPGFGRELVQKLNTTGRNFGFNDQELAGITDPRMIKVLHAAMQFEAMQAKKPAVLEKVKAAPQKPAKQTASKPASGIEKDIKQFQSKKDLNSFARLLAHSYK